jgi:DNA topoisomerase-1
VKSLEKCDFKPMFEYFEGEKEKKKAMTADQKKQYVFRRLERS